MNINETLDNISANLIENGYLNDDEKNIVFEALFHNDITIVQAAIFIITGQHIDDILPLLEKFDLFPLSTKSIFIPFLAAIENYQIFKIILFISGKSFLLIGFLFVFNENPSFFISI